MQTFEVEQKYQLRHPVVVRRLLLRLGAKKIQGGREYNELLDLKGILKKRGCLLRLRKGAGKQSYLTFKGARLKGRYKKRLEIETSVDFKRAKEIFKFLGFKVVARYSKKREEFKLGACKVALDYLPKIGWYLEIEGNPKQIQETARRLGLEDSKREERSYLSLLNV